MAYKNRALITSVGRKVALVQAFKDAGWRVYGQDSDPLAIALKFCDEVYINPPVDYTVHTRDIELPDVYPYSTCVDKFKFYKWCKANGFRTPEVYFVKPRVSKSGKEVECVFQEFISGYKEYSIDIFCDFQNNPINVVPRSRDLVVGGESWVSTTVDAPILIDTAIKLSKTLGLIGHNVIQCFWDGVSEPIVLECNCRFGGQSNLAIKSGCNSPLYLLKLVNGESLTPEIGNYKKNMKVYSYREDFFEHN